MPIYTAHAIEKMRYRANTFLLKASDAVDAADNLSASFDLRCKQILKVFHPCLRAILFMGPNLTSDTIGLIDKKPQKANGAEQC